MELSIIQKLVRESYEKLGFKDQFTQIDIKSYVLTNFIERREKFRSFFIKSDVLMDIAEIGLFTEEVGELLEAIRKDYPLMVPEKTKEITSVGEECADIVIRVMNFCNRKGIILEDEILKKNKYNMNRGYLHNKKA